MHHHPAAGLAQALVSAPRLLILDEPTIGLDPIARTGVWEHITAVREATGMTVLVTTHYMDEADQYCDRVGLMHRGRIRALGTPVELRQGLGERRRAEGAPATAPLPTLEDVFRDVAGIVLSRDRLMGFGQAITMPLFFGSNALYPVDIMPGWLQAVSKVNPLSYEVDALRGLLLGTAAHFALDFGVLFVAAALGITAASALLGRLAR